MIGYFTDGEVGGLKKYLATVEATQTDDIDWGSTCLLLHLSIELYATDSHLGSQFLYTEITVTYLFLYVLT